MPKVTRRAIKVTIWKCMQQTSTQFALETKVTSRATKVTIWNACNKQTKFALENKGDEEGNAGANNLNHVCQTR